MLLVGMWMVFLIKSLFFNGVFDLYFSVSNNFYCDFFIKAITQLRSFLLLCFVDVLVLAK
ncbi:MAG: hypothetical protein RL571_2841 [Pseudomonadota bacterium]|jgi:hypothetical protein